MRMHSLSPLKLLLVEETAQPLHSLQLPDFSIQIAVYVELTNIFPTFFPRFSHALLV